MIFRSFAVSSPSDYKYRFDSASLCVGFEGMACFDALLLQLEEVAVFSCDMTSLDK